MLVFGKSSFPERDVGSSSKNSVLKNQSIKKAALGDQSSCLLFDDGSISTFGKKLEDGNPVHGQTESTFHEDLKYLDLFGGSKHTFVLDREQKLYGWGCNDEGQLGVESENEVLIPKLIPFFLTKKVVQVACGQSHTLLLTINGSMYVMGDNTYSQLGVETLEAKSVTEPRCVDSLTGVPVSQIAAGGWHSFCVTTSGRLFSWGRNEYGQLGLENNVNYICPTLMKTLNHSVAFVAAGHHHSAILTKSGQVLTFGLGSSGQLGHNSSENESTPKLVEELRGSVVTQIACGCNHTVVFVPDCCHVFVFGDNADGQLGFDQKLKTKIINPEILRWPEFSHKFSLVDSNNDECHGVLELFACDNQTVILLSDKSKSLDFRHIESKRCIATFDETFSVKILQLSDGEIDVDIAERLCCVMTSLSCLNGCFQVHDQMAINDNPGIDLTVAKSVFACICSHNLRDVIVTCLSESLLPSMSTCPLDIDEALRVYIFLPFILELFTDAENMEKLYFPFIENILNLDGSWREVLNRWYKFIGSHFSCIIKLCCIGIGLVLEGAIPVGVKSEPMKNMLEFIRGLYEFNARNEIVSYRDFYLSCNVSADFLCNQYAAWKSPLEEEPMFVSHKYLFDAKVKSLLFHVSAKYKKAIIATEIQKLTFLSMMGFNFGDYQLPITKIEVDRKSLVTDAIHQLGHVTDFQALFQVRFKGEEGIDDGALTKEFFMLVLQEVLDPSFGIFVLNEESNLLWFSDVTRDYESIYDLVGVLCGIALHNDAILNVNFPLAMYKKLLGEEVDLEDMKELDPVVGSSLQQLLDFEEEDDLTVEGVFGLCFTSSDGKSLKLGLEDIAVTSENRNEYVRLYIDYVFNDSVKDQYESFSKGFQKVCKGELFDLFHPEELREIVVGQQDFDWKKVEDRMMKQCAGSLTPSEFLVTVWFWDVIHSLKEEEKEEFLLFLTGSSNIPITGLDMTIEFREEDDDFLPVAYTCYNLLQLHLYSSKEILEERLKLSIKCKGFYIA